LLMTSNPMNDARTNTNNAAINASFIFFFAVGDKGGFSCVVILLGDMG
jgi:hypothetical protein